MKTDENKRKAVHLAGDTSGTEGQEEGGPKFTMERLKRPLIYVLMAIVFAGCLYLIFQPSDIQGQAEMAGINDAVPQPNDTGLESDKQKAYKQEDLEQLQQQKKKGLESLSDFWNENTQGQDSTMQNAASPEEIHIGNGQGNTADAPSTYRSVKSTLGGFYESDTEKTQLQKEVESLRQQLDQKKAAAVSPMQSQLALMEKSYQLAAKYFPGSGGQKRNDSSAVADTPRGAFSVLQSRSHDAVSALPRAADDAALLRGVNPSGGFRDAEMPPEGTTQKNSVLACIHQSQKITGEGTIRLRLLEAAQIRGIVLPEGTLLSGNAKLQNGRLAVKVSSLGAGGTILPVDIIVYDLDGQPGLQAPFSEGAGAARGIVANMGQSAGTNMMLTRSAGQQVAADLSRGVIQGVSGYFSKSVKAPRIELRAGYKVLLVSKK